MICVRLFPNAVNHCCIPGAGREVLRHDDNELRQPIADERVSLFEEDIGAKTFCRNDVAVVEIRTTEVGIIPKVRRSVSSAQRVGEHVGATW